MNNLEKVSASEPKKSGLMPLLLGVLVLSLGAFGFFFSKSYGDAIPIGDPVVTEVVEPTPKSLPKINGQNVNFISFGNSFLRNTGRKNWLQEDAEFKLSYEFKEQSRDDYSVGFKNHEGFVL